MAEEKSHRGIALLIVLWIITILMVMVFSFSSLSRTESFAALNFRETIEKRYLAEAGIERGIIELLHRRQNPTADMTDIWKTDGRSSIVDIGDSHCAIRISEESGRLDINMLTDASGILLKNLLIMRGTTADEADTIVDSLLDWKDSGDSGAHRLHGAESEYYQGLPSPYTAKNANFDSVEELLLVKGMTPEILFGSQGRKGIFDLLTVHAKTARININAAPEDLLASLPGLGPERAAALVLQRQEKGALTTADLQGLMGADFAVVNAYIGAIGTQTYTIDSFGYKETGKPGFSIKATVTFRDNSQYQYLYYKSPAGTAQ